MSILYSKTDPDHLSLQNHLVICSLTRNRAIDNLPNALMKEYYV